MSRAIPIRRKDFDVQGFLAFVAREGGEVGTPTNMYEVVRYRAYWRGTNTSSVHIVYAKENGLLTWTGGSEGHYRAFVDGAPMEELPGHKREPFGKTGTFVKPETTESKGAAMRRKLLARDGDGCWFCGAPMGDDCTIEHLIAKANGGRNALANYALAHKQCNADAADLPLVDKIAMRVRLHSPRGTPAATAAADTSTQPSSAAAEPGTGEG